MLTEHIVEYFHMVKNLLRWKMSTVRYWIIMQKWIFLDRVNSCNLEHNRSYVILNIFTS